MTRAHFELIAEVVRELEFIGDERMVRATREHIAGKFADALYATNPRFDRGRFVRRSCQGA